MLENYDYCKYTYLHRKALMYYIKNNKYLTNEERLELMKRAKIHDMDKLTLYLFWDKKEASKYHRSTATHHLKENTTGYIQNDMDILECIFDMECVALTKSDKPLNAYDTIEKWYPDLMNRILPFLKRLHMDSSYCAITQDAIDYINTIKVNEDVILDEVAIYLVENENNVYQVLKDKCCLDFQYKELLQRYDIYCLKKFVNFYKDNRKNKFYYISKDLIDGCKIIQFKTEGVSSFYVYAKVNSSNISLKIFDNKVEKFNKIAFNYYEKPMLMQLQEEEYMCSCGTKFYGKQSKCNYCGNFFFYENE